VATRCKQKFKYKFSFKFILWTFGQAKIFVSNFDTNFFMLLNTKFKISDKKWIAQLWLRISCEIIHDASYTLSVYFNWGREERKKEPRRSKLMEGKLARAHPLCGSIWMGMYTQPLTMLLIWLWTQENNICALVFENHSSLNFMLLRKSAEGWWALKMVLKYIP